MIDPDLRAVPVQRKTGSEFFRDGDRTLPFDLRDFWQWSTSDLLSNATRGIVAEYLVAQGVGVAVGARAEWSAYDLATPEGITIEVKSAAYVQRWGQKRLSTVGFGIEPTRGWCPESSEVATKAQRQAAVYVFALLTTREKARCDPMDVSQWSFYVVATRVLDERVGAKSRLSLADIARLGANPVAFQDLRRAVREAGQSRVS